MFNASWSLQPDSRLAAMDLVRHQPFAASARWGMLFASGFHQPQWLFSEVRRLLGDKPLFGGSCCGIITPAGVDYGGFEALLLLFDSPCDSLCLPQQDQQGLLNWIGNDHALCFFDLLGSPVRDLFDSARHQQLQGAALLGDFGLRTSFMFCGDKVANDCLVAIKLPAPTTMAVSHGAIPISDPLTITAGQGGLVQSLDGQPALDCLLALLGQDEAKLRGSLLHQLSLGQPWNNTYSSHMIAKLDSQSRSLHLGTGQFETGQKVVLMSRSVDSTWQDTRMQLAAFGKDKPSFYINCAGRTAAFSGALQEESELVRQYLGREMAGIFSGAELASLNGQPRLMNWTGVLMQWS